MEKIEQTTISRREKIVIILVVFLIKMIKPWEYDHQFTKFWDEIKANF